MPREIRAIDTWWVRCPSCFTKLEYYDNHRQPNNPDDAIAIHVGGCHLAINDPSMKPVFTRIRASY
jgi:hypothetical protein